MKKDELNLVLSHTLVLYEAAIWSVDKTDGMVGGNAPDNPDVASIVYPAGGRATGVDVELGAADVHYWAPEHLGSYTADGLMTMVNSGANLLPMTMV